MGIPLEFDNFEKEFMELISEFQILNSSESRLREEVRRESTRAEAAESARAAAERVTGEARANAAAAAATAAHAAHSLQTAQEEIVTLKMNLELAEHQSSLLENKCSELMNQMASLDKELQQLRPMLSIHSTLKNQYVELLDRINAATEDSRSEASRLEDELRRVEKCASAGAEVRSRARLAASAHARERRLAAAELHHTARELHLAYVEIARLGGVVSELQYRLAEADGDVKGRAKVRDPDEEALEELKAELEAERAGAARLQRALTAALADNAALAAQIHDSDNAATGGLLDTQPDLSRSTSINPIDIFLGDC